MAPMSLYDVDLLVIVPILIAFIPLITFKVLYTTRGRVGYKRGQSVNAVGNHRAIGFYLGDDCLSDMINFMSHAPKELEDI